MTPDALEQAITFIEDRDYAAAEPLLVELLEQEPMNARVNYALALVAMARSDYSVALHLLEKAARVATRQPFVFTALAEVLLKTGDAASAVDAARHSVSLDTTSASAHEILGEAYLADGRPVMARPAFIAALKIAPERASVLAKLAHVERMLGETAVANDHIKSALGYDPMDTDALMASVQNSLYEDREAMRATLEKAAAQDHQPGEDRFRLAMAAGRLAEDSGDLEGAYENYGKYRTLGYPPYDPKLRSWQLDSYRQVFNREYFMHRFSAAFESTRPVFLVGFPGAGTELVEDLLARHLKIEAGGEVPFFSIVGRQLRVDPKITPQYFQAAMHLPEKEYKRIGRAYLQTLEGVDKKAAHIVDRMTGNYEHLWLLALLFPRATFVHVTRAPFDTCASVYRTPVSSVQNYNVSQEALAHHHRTYRDLMAFWGEVLPTDMIEIRYEDVIADPEAEIGKIWEAMGLPGNAAKDAEQAADIVSKHRARLEPASSEGRESALRHLKTLSDALGVGGGHTKALH